MKKVNYARAMQAPVQTPQTQQADPRQVLNAAGGYVFEAKLEDQLKRFLILGTESGTYYVKEEKLSKSNTTMAQRALDQLGPKAVNVLVEVALGRLAPKKQPQLFFLALALSHPNPDVKNAAQAAFSVVVRTGYDLLIFVGQVDQLRGWGRKLKKTLAGWFNQPDNDLVYQVMKYRQREGWSLRDVLRKLRVEPLHPFQDAVFHWLTKEDPSKLAELYLLKPEGFVAPEARLIQAHHLIKTPGFTEEQAADAIRRFNLPREVVPTNLLKSRVVWDALLEKAPPTMALRNLGRLQKLYGARSDELLSAVRQRLSHEAVVKSRLHPMAVFLAITTYEAQRGEKGSLTWEMDTRVLDHLHQVFSWTIPNSEPVAGRHIIAIDRSGSMTAPVLGSERVSAGNAASAMAYVLFKRQPDTTRVLTFGDRLAEIPVVASASFGEFQRLTGPNMGGTDCSLPVRWCLEQTKAQPQDVLTILTDNETWAGTVHLHELRKVMPTLRIVNVAMAATPSSLRDPDDRYSLDLVGFDPTVPGVISQFSQGLI